MRKKALIVDLDNTLVDTAIRKHSLLRDFLAGQEISVAKVREDFDLFTILGPTETEANKSFMARLNSDDGIRNHPAPLFEGVDAVLANMTKLGVEVIVITGRPEALRTVTIEELNNLQIQQYISALYMLQPDFTKIEPWKKKQLYSIIQSYDVIAVIGDHQDDFNAAATHRLPFIQVSKTLAQQNYNNAEFGGGAICRTWDDVRQSLDIILDGRMKLQELRKDFTDSYARWLADLDNKGRITATISGVLAALAGKLAIDLKPPLHLSDYLLIACLCLAVVSLLYCIRSMTSRRTSGSSAGGNISTTAKQWFSILIGSPKRWRCVQGDPIDAYLKLSEKKPEEQARSHYDFFFDSFKTYDPEALANLRLFQLRSVNYSKAYAENIASRLLIISILFFLIWFLSRFFFGYAFICG